MDRSFRLSDVFDSRKDSKVVLITAIIFLLLLEVVIYAAVSSQAGLRSRIVIVDSSGTKIYESPGTSLSSYEKMVFESNFGPLRNFATHIESETIPFAFRTWVLLSIGIPLGLILLVFFLVQVWVILLNGTQKSGEDPSSASGKNRFDTFLSASRNFSVLHVGFVIVLAMLMLWLIPSFLGDVVKSCFEAMKNYPWFFVASAGFVAGLLVWVIYLRYRLSKQMLSNQFEIEKYRIKTELLTQSPPQRLLTSAAKEEAEETRVNL